MYTVEKNGKTQKLSSIVQLKAYKNAGWAIKSIDLKAMSALQLLDYAKKKGVDVGDAKTEAEIIAALKAAGADK